MEYMSTDKQYDGMLIEQYFMLKRLREKATEGTVEKTVEAIDKELECIRLKLRPISLPDEENS